MYSLQDGLVAQGVPVIAITEEGSPALFFDYQKLLPNGSSLLLRQTLLSTLHQENLAGIPSFFIAGNNMKVSFLFWITIICAFFVFYFTILKI